MDEMRPGFLLDILAFGGQDVSPTGSITVAAVAVAYSKSFPLRRGMTFGWEITFDSPGNVNVKVELEESSFRPTVEGAADLNFVVPDDKVIDPLFAAITDKVLHQTAYDPDALAFGRLKFTGLGNNDAATKCTVARVYTIKNV